MINLHEFYQQLGLLVKSKLPLPEAMRQLEKTLNGPMYKTIERDLKNGLQLHESLAKYPSSFPDEHLRLIKLAEEKNTLCETLVELAKFSHFEKVIQAKTRDVLFYPLLIVCFGLVILGIVGKAFIYPMSHIVFDLGMLGEQQPFFYKIARAVGVITHEYASIYWFSAFTLFLLICLLVFNILRVRLIDNMWMKVTSLWTDFSGIFESSRLCSFLSLQFKNRIDLNDSCSSASMFVSNSLSRELQLCSEKLENGFSSKEIFQQCKFLDPLIISTLENSSESELGNEMSNLADYYFERVYSTSERLLTYWKVISTLITAILVFILLQIMFSPIMYLIRMM